jgi:hypothetical protein
MLAPGFGRIDRGVDERDGLGRTAPQAGEQEGGKGGMRDPDTSQTASAFASRDAAPAKSPPQATIKADTSR